jgi:L-lactate dehydrogenase complex protein LldG
MDKQQILSKIRGSRWQSFDMPTFDALTPVAYDDKVQKFMETLEAVGGHAVLSEEGTDIDALVRSIYPEAVTVASSLPYINADMNPDEIAEASALNGTDLGVVEGVLAVAENGCVWVPQTMKERAVLFISERLIIIVDGNDIVNNMHEAYSRIQMPDYGYGCFISGPSKTADIAQALVMGAQAARDVTVIIR